MILIEPPVTFWILHVQVLILPRSSTIPKVVSTDTVTVHLVDPLFRPYPQDQYSRAQMTVQITDWRVVTEGMFVEEFRSSMEKRDEVVHGELICERSVDIVAEIGIGEDGIRLRYR